MASASAPRKPYTVPAAEAADRVKMLKTAVRGDPRFKVITLEVERGGVSYSIDTLSALRAFFHWLAGQPGYRSRLTYADADYFNLSDKETRIAKASSERPVPTVEQILHVLS